jgi:hypothetical protein
MPHNEHHLSSQSNMDGYSSNPSSDWDVPLPNVASNRNQQFIFSPDTFHIPPSDLNQFDTPSNFYPNSPSAYSNQNSIQSHVTSTPKYTLRNASEFDFPMPYRSVRHWHPEPLDPDTRSQIAENFERRTEEAQGWGQKSVTLRN